MHMCGWFCVVCIVCVACICVCARAHACMCVGVDVCFMSGFVHALYLHVLFSSVINDSFLFMYLRSILHGNGYANNKMYYCDSCNFVVRANLKIYTYKIAKWFVDSLFEVCVCINFSVIVHFILICTILVSYQKNHQWV